MEENVNATSCDGATEWTADDLKGVTDRIETAKEQSGCSIASIMEVLEILEQIEGMCSVFPPSQKRFFTETTDELIGLAISRLEWLRAELPR